MSLLIYRQCKSAVCPTQGPVIVDGDRGRWQPIITRKGWKPADFSPD